MGTCQTGTFQTALSGVAVQGLRIPVRPRKTAGDMPGMQGEAGEVREIYVMNRIKN